MLRSTVCCEVSRSHGCFWACGFVFCLLFFFLTITVLRSDFVCCVASFTRLTVTHVESDWLYGVCVVIKFSFYSRGRDDHFVRVRFVTQRFGYFLQLLCSLHANAIDALAFVQLHLVAIPSFSSRWQ